MKALSIKKKHILLQLLSKRARSLIVFGGVPEWPNGADCKSASLRLRWFESIRPHQKSVISGSSSFGRAIAFQAIGGGFEPRLPLNSIKPL